MIRPLFWRWGFIVSVWKLLLSLTKLKGFDIHWLLLSRTRLLQITAYLEVKILSQLKHENLTTDKKILCKRGEISLLFHNIFNISLISRVQLHINLFNAAVWIIFSSVMQIWYVEVLISRSFTESLGIRDNVSRLYLVVFPPFGTRGTRGENVCDLPHVCLDSVDQLPSEVSPGGGAGEGGWSHLFLLVQTPLWKREQYNFW